MQGFGNLAKIADEVAVNVDEPEERLQGFLGCGNLPLLDSSNLLRVSANLSIPYDQTKVLDFGLFEETFFGFQAKVMIM